MDDREKLNDDANAHADDHDHEHGDADEHDNAKEKAQAFVILLAGCSVALTPILLVVLHFMALSKGIVYPLNVDQILMASLVGLAAVMAFAFKKRQ